MKLESKELRREYIARINAIQGIIELVYIDSLRHPPEDDVMYITAKSWNEHFTRAGIPTSALQDLYYEATSELSDNDFFNPKHIISMWKKRQEKKSLKTSCNICNGHGSINVLNFKTGKDEPETCICQL